MKKICFYLPHLAKGGAQRVIVNLSEFFAREGYEVVLVTTMIAAIEEYPVPSGTRRVLSDITGDEITTSRVKNFYRRFQKLRNVWKTENPDIIISFIGMNNIMAIATNAFRKCPVLISVRANPPMEYYTRILRFLAKTIFIKADGIILQTKQQTGFFPKAIRRKCTILPNPINPEFVKDSYDADKEHPLRQKHIVAVGRVDINKNHFMLVKAFEEIAGEYPEWNLKIYGDGPDKEKLDAMIHSSPYQERMEAPGMISDVPDRLDQSRIYVLTSYEEGMPNSLIEAMAKGLACISTDCPCGGPDELIRNGENGILIPVGDTEALVKALKAILADAEYEKALGLNASEIKNTLNPTIVCGQWKQYIEQKMK